MGGVGLRKWASEGPWLAAPLTWRRYRGEQIWGLLGLRWLEGVEVEVSLRDPGIGTPTGTKDTDLGVAAHRGLCKDDIVQGEG